LGWIDTELVLIALAAMLSPTTLSFSVLALVLAEHPRRTGIWFYLGAFSATLAVGVLAAFVLGNVAAVLESAGAGLADVVQCRVFLADTADFRAMDRVYAQVFPPPLPARTTVGVALPLPGMLVEIDCVAVLPASAGGRP